MLTRVGSRAMGTLLNSLKECLAILAVGVLGSQLLMAINGGPIGAEAAASNRVVERGFVLVSSFDLDLDPTRHGLLRSVYLQVSTLDGSEPDQLQLAPTPASQERFDCHVHRDDDPAWHCPTPGLSVAELEQIVVSGS